MKTELVVSEKSNRCKIEFPIPDYMQFLVDGNFEIVFQSTLDGHITFRNKLFLSSFGEEERLADSIFESHGEYKTILQNLISGQNRQNLTSHFRHQSGSIIVGKMTISCYCDDDGNEIITWAVLDITEQHQIKQKLQQKDDDLIKLKAQMEQFLYKTSHDLRSPLTSVLGLINLIRFERPSDEVLDLASKIEGSINRLDNVTKDIMRFSENSYTRLHSEKVFLEPMACRIIKSFSNLPNYKLIQFDIEAEENGAFYCDNQRLEIIFTNLIRNAIMFADVNKTRPFVTVKMSAVAGGATIAIIDNGIGVGNSHLSHIFSMFYRANDRVQGAGLGLYVAKEAVTRLNGKIDVQSEVGFGSIFKVNIPNDLKGMLVAKKMRLEKK